MKKIKCLIWSIFNCIKQHKRLTNENYGHLSGLGYEELNIIDKLNEMSDKFNDN